MFCVESVFLFIHLISRVISCNYSLFPSQVLVPRIGTYRSRNGDQLMVLSVQFSLKIEPNLCVNWKLQDSHLLLFDKSNYTGLDRSSEFEYGEGSENQLRGCSSSVVLSTVPLDFGSEASKGAESPKNGSDLRTFVFAYDSNFRFHAVAEVVISELERLAVETAYRKISKNQTFTLKLRGFDRVGNTFTSLEGLPFYLSFSGPRLFDVLDVTEGEFCSEKRRKVLSQRENFDLPENSALVSDVVLLKGRRVGRTWLTFGLFLDEYSHVKTEPVEFVVNDSLVLSHENLYLVNGSSFQLGLKCPSQRLYQNGAENEVDMANYEWSTDAEVDKVTLENGLISTYLQPTGEGFGEYKFVVYCTDLRTNQVLQSHVNVVNPHSLALRYGSLQSVHKCMASHFSSDSPQQSHSGFLEVFGEFDSDGPECYGLREAEDRVVSLLQGSQYLFRFSLLTFNKNVFNTANSKSLRFRAVKQAEDFGGVELLDLVEQNKGDCLFKASKIGCQDYELAYVDNQLVSRYKVCVLEQVGLEGFEALERSETQLFGGKLSEYAYAFSRRPVVVSVGDLFELKPKGGSGGYRFELEGCQGDGGRFVCKKRGSFELRVFDRDNEENFAVFQVISTSVKSAKFSHQNVQNRELNVRLNSAFGLRLSLYGDLSGFKPLFKPEFSHEDSRLYSFSYAENNYLVPLRVNINPVKPSDSVNPGDMGDTGDTVDSVESVDLVKYDREVLESKSCERENGSLVLSFRALASGSTKVGLNTGFLKAFSEAESGGEVKELSESFLRVNVYRDPELQLRPEYQLPVINFAALVKAGSEVLANVPVGGKAEFNYRFGLPGHRPKMAKVTNHEVLFIEALDEGFAVYCLSPGHEDVSFELFEYRRVYRITCSVPKYSLLLPLERLTGNLYEILAQEAGDGYTVNKDRANSFLSVLYDDDDRPLLPSSLYRPYFYLGQNQLSGSEAECSAIAVFNLDSFDRPEIDLVGGFRYENAPENYSAGFNRLYRFKRFNQQVVSYLRNASWDKRSRSYFFQSSLVLKMRSNPSVLVFTSGDSGSLDGNVYAMFNRQFEYRLFVHGGSGNYSVVSSSTSLKHSFSHFGAVKGDEEPLPISLKGSNLVLNLFDENELNSGLSADSPGDYVLKLNDEGLLWSETLTLYLHLKNPTQFKVSLVPLHHDTTKPDNLVDSDEGVVLSRYREEMLYLDERYKVDFEAYCNENRLVAKTSLFALELLNANLDLEYRRSGGVFEGFDQLVVRGDDEVVLKALAVGSGGMVVRDFERILKVPYKFRVVEKPMLNYSHITLLPKTTLDVSFQSVTGFENFTDFGNLVVKVKSHGTASELEGFEFERYGEHKFDVEVMYEGNLLTRLSQEMRVTVSRPSRMSVSLFNSHEFLSRDSENSFSVDKLSVHNVNLELYDEQNNLFTLLYLSNPSLQFTYKFTPLGKTSQGCRVLGHDVGNGPEWVTNRCNAQFLVLDDCEVEVSARYENALVGLKKLKFKVNTPERLFNDYNTKHDDTQGQSCGYSKVKMSGCDYCKQVYGQFYGYCDQMNVVENLCVGGVYEIKKTFTSYPENTLVHLGDHFYRANNHGSVLLTTESNSHVLELLKPTHLSLALQNHTHVQNPTNSSDGVDFTTYNMKNMSFKINLHSNLSRVRMPVNARFSVRMKDSLVFSFTLEGDELVLKPQRVGDTTMEVLFQCGGGSERLNRVYFLRSASNERMSVYSAFRGATVFLSGSRVSDVVVNLDANSHEFARLLRNKFTPKSFGPCSGPECAVTHVNPNELFDGPAKLAGAISTHRGSYRMLLGLVTNSLNSLFGAEAKSEGLGLVKLFDANSVKETFHCTDSHCRLQLRYKLSTPITASQLSGVNLLLHSHSRASDENFEDFVGMLCTPLLGLDDSGWRGEFGPVEPVFRPEKLGSFELKNAENELVLLNVTAFNASNFQFRQLNPSTIVLTETQNSQPFLANTANLGYFSHRLGYSFRNQQLDRLFHLRQVYQPDGSGKLYRLGFHILLKNTVNRDWSVFKNYLRSMSTDLLKGKHKLHLQLFHSTMDNLDPTRIEGVDGVGTESELKLLESDLEIELPEGVLFVNSSGHIVNEVGESNLGTLLHVYPFDSAYKLQLTSNSYLLKTIERSGQLTSFVVYSNKSAPNSEPNSQHTGDFLMVLNHSNNIVAKIRVSSTGSAGFSSAQLNLFNRVKFSDLLHISLVLVLMLFVLFVYNTLRTHQYYEPTVPIKLERSLPKAFDNLYQTRYKYPN